MASTRTIDCATETSRIGSEITTASASITRYCEPNQLALTTLGLVLPLIRPPTFCRNHCPAADTAAVKLRSALSPAAETTPVAAPVRALPTEWPAPAPAWQIWRAIGVCTPAHLSVCAFCWVVGGVVVEVGACWASAAGATTRMDARARPITSRSQRPRGRSRSWSIVIVLELLKLMDEVRGRGRVIGIGDGDRPVPDRGGGLLPVLVDPLELHRGHAPGLLGRQARVLVAADTVLPDGDAGVAGVVGVDVVANGHGLEDHLAGVQPRERLVGVVETEERGGDELGLVLQVAPEPLAGLGGRDGVDRGVAPGRVEHELTGGQRGGVVGGGADGAGLGVVPADRHAVDGAPAPDLLAVDRQRPGGRHGLCRRALRGRGTRSGGGRRLWRGGGVLRRRDLPGWRGAGPAADQQPAGEQREGECEQAEQAESAGGSGASLLGQAVDHPRPALLTYGQPRSPSPSTGPATASAVPVPCTTPRPGAGARFTGVTRSRFPGPFRRRERPIDQCGGGADDHRADDRIQRGAFAHRGLMVVRAEGTDPPHRSADDDTGQRQEQGEGTHAVDHVLKRPGTGQRREVRREVDPCLGDDYVQVVAHRHVPPWHDAVPSPSAAAPSRRSSSFCVFVVCSRAICRRWLLRSRTRRPRRRRLTGRRAVWSGAGARRRFRLQRQDAGPREPGPRRGSGRRSAP